MTNYSKTTNFTAKDSLVSGDANKIVKGSEIDAEFDNIATASATKANIASPAFTGVVSFPDGTAGDPSITNTGDTNTGLFFSAADTLAFSAAGTAQFTMADGAIAPVTDNDVDLGTSSLEFKDGYFDGTLYTDAINLDGTAITSTAAEINILDGVTATAAELNILDGVTSTAAELNILDGVTSTAAELNILDGVTATTAELNYNDTGSAVGTVVASKVVTVDANKDVASFRNITLTGELDAGSLDISGDADIDGTLETDALSINGTAVTSTAAELNILDGVTSTAAELNILDGVTSTTAELNILDGVTSTAAELNILDGVTSTTAELNILDGVTAVAGELNALDLGSTAVGTAIASKAVILDANKDYTGIRNFTITGELDAATLDISGDIDVDGTTNLDVVDIDGAVDMASTLAVGGAVTIDPADGVADDAYALFVRNNEATAGRNYGAMVRGGSNSSDEAFTVRNFDNSSTYFTVRGDGASTFSGSVTADGLTVSGDAVFTPDNDGVRITGASYATLRLEENDTTDVNTTLFNSSGDFVITTSNDARSTTVDRFRLDHATGDIGFYNAAGSSQGLFWDASAESLGIGTSSVGATLDVNDTGATNNAWNTIAKFRPDVSDANAEASIHIQSYPSTTVVADRRAGIQSIDDAGNARPLILNKDGGNVGIGVSLPQEKLHVYTTGNSRVEAESTTGVAAFKATNNSGSYGWYVDNSADAFHLFDFTDSAQRVTVDGDGKMGIGTTPSATLDILTAANTQPLNIKAATDGYNYVSIENAAGNDVGYFGLGSALVSGGSADDFAIRAQRNDLVFLTGGANERMRIDQLGNVGIGVTSVQASAAGKTLETSGCLISGGTLSAHQTNRAVIEYNVGSNSMNIRAYGATAGSGIMIFSTGGGGGSTDSEAMRIDSSGAVIVNNAGGDAQIYLGGTSGTDRMYLARSGNDALLWNVDSGVMSFGTNNTKAYEIGATNNHVFYQTNGSTVGMELSASGSLAVAGALSKGSGSFKIDHPLPAKTDTHLLVHSFIEGPQADLIYRGSIDLSGGSATVDLDAAAGMTEGTFVLLNTNVQCFTSNESGWTAIKGSVSGNTLTITAQDNTCTDTISWMVVGERKDQHMLDTEWTDENGKVIVEPIKPVIEE